ncbi:hypothetical protein ABPG72_017053 [Tetrahymena utriculariae]
MKIQLQILLIIFFFLRDIYSEGLLISDEFHLEMSASSIQGWPSLTIKCTSTDYVNRSNQMMYGIIDKSNNQNIKKTYSITQPHWSVSVRVNIYTLKSFAASDNIKVFMDGNMQAQYQKGTNGGIGKSLCLSNNDYLYQFYKNITHSQNTFDLTFQSSISTAASTGGFALSELYIEIDTCYPGCQTCSGPAMNQCATCITGAVANNGQCQCTTGFAYLTSCVTTCPAGFRGEPTLLICVQDYCDTSVCQTCYHPKSVCTSCKSGFQLLEKQCVTSCPTYTTKQGNICKDILPSNGMYLLKALFQQFVSESEIAAGGLTVTGLEGNGYGTVQQQVLVLTHQFAVEFITLVALCQLQLMHYFKDLFLDYLLTLRQELVLHLQQQMNGIVNIFTLTMMVNMLPNLW